MIQRPPTSATPAATPTVAAVAADSPACRAANLSARVVFIPVGAGNDAYRITITDNGGACTLHGRPSSLYGVDAQGRRTKLHPGALSADYTAALTTHRPAHLMSGNDGEVVLVTTIGCRAGQRHPFMDHTYASLRLGVGRSTIRVPYAGGPEPADTGIWLPCGVAMSDFFAAE